MAGVTGKKGIGIPSIVLHEGEGTIVTIGAFSHAIAMLYVMHGFAGPRAPLLLAEPVPPSPVHDVLDSLASYDEFLRFTPSIRAYINIYLG